MTEAVVATIPKNKREEIRVSVGHFEGRPIANVRVWFRDAAGEMKPGKSGLAFRVDLLPELSGAMLKALDRAREEGML